MGVGQPRVHGRDAGLGSVADQNEHERQTKHLRVHRRRRRDDRIPMEGRGHRPELLADVDVAQHRAREGQGDPHGADQEVLPRSLDRRFRPRDRHQQCRSHRCRLDRDPHDRQVVDRDGDEHSRHEYVDENAEHPQLCVGVLLARADERAHPCGEGRDEGDADRQQHGQRIEPEPAGGGRERSFAKHPRPGEERRAERRGGQHGRHHAEGAAIRARQHSDGCRRKR